MLARHSEITDLDHSVDRKDVFQTDGLPQRVKRSILSGKTLLVLLGQRAAVGGTGPEQPES